MKALVSLVALGLALSLGAPALAQDFPTRPVRIIVGFAAGGGVDVTARLIGNKLSALWGQPVVVENKVGASGFIGADLVAKSPPDGYTVVMSVPNSHTIGPHLVKPPYDPLRDFTPITLLITFPNVLVVGNSVPAGSMAELVALEKAKPGSLNFASSGIGSTQHLAGEMFNLAAGIKAVHVPYKGSAGAMIDLIGGSVTFSFDTATGTIAHIRGGKLKPLAVTSRKRIPALPNVPTTAEAGYPAVEMSTWYGLEGPPGMPKALLDKWHKDVVKVLQMPDVRARIEELAGESVGNTPEEFRAYLENEFTRMGKLARDANLKAD
jgi:tripartite-type tricarboxylate transporter receptor subunit TctC